MKLENAELIGRRVIELLQPACEKIELAGSVRRQKPDVGDVEIVALPIVAELPGFFGITESTSRLELRIRELLASGTLVLDPVVRRNGPKAKRFVQEGIAIDLFIGNEDNYGNTLTIRTGNADFSHALVTPRRVGGLMPGHLVQRDGYLWRAGELIPCPTEQSFFDALGLRWIEPEFRNAGVVRELARHSMESRA